MLAKKTIKFVTFMELYLNKYLIDAGDCLQKQILFKSKEDGPFCEGSVLQWYLTGKR